MSAPAPRRAAGRLGEMARHQRQRREQFAEMARRYAREGCPRARPPDFVEALRRARRGEAGGRLPVVAEVKRRSPSAGPIAEGRDAVRQAAGYVRGGAAAISVLADDAFFGGSPADVRAVCESVAAEVPVLYKDVVVCPEQLELARACGASAVLLIAAALEQEELARLAHRTCELGLVPVVEVHDEEELGPALALPEVRVIGVNNRDLRTFAVDTRRSLELLPRVPGDRVRLAESGYRTPAEMARAWAAGADAVLVGEALMRAEDPEAFLAEVRREWERVCRAAAAGGAP